MMILKKYINQEKDKKLESTKITYKTHNPSHET